MGVESVDAGCYRFLYEENEAEAGRFCSRFFEDVHKTGCASYRA